MSRSSFRSFKIASEDADIFAACFAQIAFQLDETIDEVECFDMARERIRKCGGLNYMDAVELGLMFKTTKFDAKRGMWN